MNKEEDKNKSLESGIPEQADNIQNTADLHAITTQPSEIKAMEVHHHPHVEKKNFKEYILEGLMIFFAVTMGFIAENIREHIVDEEKEEQYIQSFYADLSNDEKSLPDLAANINRQLMEADSLQLLLPTLDTKTPANTTYVYLRRLMRQQGINLYVNDRTVVQLRNSGGMRLIQNKAVSDSIVAYYKAIEWVGFLQDYLRSSKNAFRKSFTPLLNSADYTKVVDSVDHIVYPINNLFLRTSDPDIINKCLLNVSDIRGLSSYIRKAVLHIKDEATIIKGFIGKEYDIKKPGNE